MQLVKTVAATLAVLAVLLLLAIYGGSRWLANNQDLIAEGVGTAKIVGKALKAQCDQLEARYQREWDDAVNSDTIDRREDDFAAMRQEIDRICTAK